ncbi:MAG TPA: replicative DNA helicase [Saprospiraceae bacterium]|nr:replicative DNA helicase [Saprospiraceae bacterium]
MFKRDIFVQGRRIEIIDMFEREAKKDDKKWSSQYGKKKPALGGSEVYGKMAPQARDLEEAVLGAILVDKDAFASVMEILNRDSYYVQAHQAIYQAMQDLFEDSKPIDIITVTEQLKTNGEMSVAGGPVYIMELSQKVASSANIEYHARILAEKQIQRDLITTANAIIKDAYEDSTDVFELLDQSEQRLFAITQNNLGRKTQSMSAVLAKVMKNLETLSEKDESITGIPSGFSELDKVTSGWQRSDLVIIAARPGMGKTAFTLNLARNAAVQGHAVAIFSLEMSNEQLVSRILSSEVGLEGKKIRNGNLSESEWKILHSKIPELEKLKIFSDDTPGINSFELRAKCRRLKKQHNIDLIIIDYLQLMTGGNKNTGNREQEISSISRALKSLAKELSVPVIALSQLNRSVEVRGGDKRPVLSDLRESGAIEQDADIVSFIYRPEYYGFETWQDDDNMDNCEGQAEFIVAKHRNGELKSIRMKFIKEYAKFENLDQFNFDEGGEYTEDGQAFITRSSKMNADDFDF